MTLKRYLVLFSLATLIAWIGWLFILFEVNPDNADLFWIIIFYLSLLVALFGTCSMIGFFVRVWLSSEERLFKHLSVSSRQGALLALFLVGLLLLQANNFLVWWNVLVLCLAVVIVELFFMTVTSKK